MYKQFAPPVIRCRWLQAQAEVRWALFSAALDVQLNGSDVLKDHPDPLIGGLFDYVAFEGGFELRSKWALEEKLCAKRNLEPGPLVLTVGRRGK